MKKIISLIAFLVLTSCATKVALSPDYWNKPSKVGVLVHVNNPAKYRTGAQGLLDMAVTSGNSGYREALDLIGKEIQPKDELISMYSKLLQSKGKELIIIDEDFNAKTAVLFKGQKKEGAKYSRYDFSDLKSKYNIDELLFVDVSYGFMVSYYGMIETGRNAYVFFDTKLISLPDHSLIMANGQGQVEILKKWKKNNYESSIQGVKTALGKVKEVEKTKFN